MKFAKQKVQKPEHTTLDRSFAVVGAKLDVARKADVSAFVENHTIS